MQKLVLCVLVGSAAAASQQQSVTPIQKVIQMMDEMMAKGKAEKKDEAERFAEYQTFCKDTSWDKSTSIKTAADSIEQLSADISTAEADIMTATKDIAALNNDLTTWNADVKTNTRMRNDAHATFTLVHTDYTESIDAVERALTTLKAGPGLSASLAQTSLLQLSHADAKKAIFSFLQQMQPMNALLQDAENMEQPQAKAVNYGSSSQTVIDMVESLGEKFSDERAELEKKEATEKHAFDMMMQDLTTSISRGTEERDSKIAFKAKTEGDKAAAEGDLADTTAAKTADEKALSDLTTECAQKAADFEQRQQLRGEELEAIQQAIDIMSSDSVAGSGEKHLPQLIQKSATSFAQLRSNSQNSLQMAVASFLREKADKMNSRVLSLLATKVNADPFAKVVKMIQDMITKLTEEANEEAEHKGFCDAEMSQNKQTRDTKTEESDTLKALIEELSADIAKLSQELSDLAEAISALDKSVSEATSLRAAEKEKNTQTISDAAAGKVAVSRAISVLKEFYAKAGKATAFTQYPGAPETFDKPYKGMEGGGVMGMLDVCLSDFERLEADTTTGEAENQKIYDEFMADSSADKEAKEAETKQKEATKQEKESANAQAKKDLAGVTEELNAAMAYYEKLKPSCVEERENYEERVARRKEEIESLQEALKILNGESV